MAIVVIVAVLGIGAAVQAVTGAGFGLVAAPVLLMLRPAMVPAQLLWLTLLLCALVIVRERKSIDRRGLTVALLGAAPGAAVAVLLAAAATPRLLNIGVAVLILAASVCGLLGVRAPGAGPTPIVAAGFFAGVLNQLVALPGPPMAVGYRPPDVATLRTTLSAFFAVLDVISLIILYATGRASMADATAAMWLAIPVVVGFTVVLPVARRISAPLVTRIVLWLSLGAALSLFVQ